MTDAVRLRDIVESDLPIFFEHQQDHEAIHMAAFTAEDPADRNAFDAHWNRILSNDTVVIRTVLVDDEVAGHIASFERSGQPEVTYWIGRSFWGKGIATRSLSLFLDEVTVRPLHARAATDNLASIRVLRKCGFTVAGTERSHANARGQEIEETILELTS